MDDHLELYFNQWGFSSLKSANGDVSFRTRTGVRMPLGSKLSANAQVNYDYESDPGPGRPETDRGGLTCSYIQNEPDCNFWQPEER